MEIVLGCDHGGVELKEWIRERLENEGYVVMDTGIRPGQQADYPQVARTVSKIGLESPGRLGLLFCGTGIGISMAANKVPGIRAALCSDCYSARMAREHNNANVLAFGGRTMGREHVWLMIQTFLQAKFQGGVHALRVEMLET